MDWKVFFATFGAIFLAELADKTQLVGISMAAESKRPLSVWLGSVCGYMIITAISVILGTIFAKLFKPELIRYASASIFMIIGLLIFMGKI